MGLRSIKWGFIGLVCLFCISSVNATHPQHHYGWLEAVRLAPYDAKVIAKFDTGAKTSSVNARHVMYYQKGNETWVRFTVPLKRSQTELCFDKKVEARSKIKIKEGVATKTQKRYLERPVVNMTLCIGGERYSILMNLADRHSFNYTLLIGRDAIIQMHASIDPAETFTRKLAC